MRLKKRFIYYFIITGALITASGIVFYMAKIYPVALVNGSPVWYRTWERSLGGTAHALAVQARANNTPFTPDALLISAVRKETLSSLIENKIIISQGRVLVSQFDTETEKRVAKAVGGSPNIEKGAQFMYGFSAANFHDLILLPQARREVVHEELMRVNISFDAWLSGDKKKSRVHIFLPDMQWTGDDIK